MKKRVLALLLSVLMTLSLLPVSAFAADLDGADLGTVLDTVTGGKYTDESAESGKSYEYTIVGSDGSQQTVTVTAADDTGDVDDNSIYGTVGTETGSGTYYQLVTTGADGIEDGQKYLIVSANDGTGYAAMATTTGGSSATAVPATAVTISNGKITQVVDDNAVFTLQANGTKWTIVNASGNYYFNWGSNVYPNWTYSAYPVKINTADAGSGAVYVLDADGQTCYLYYNSTSGAYQSTYTATSVYLFREIVEPEGTTYYVVNWNEAATTLLNECGNLTKDKYTEDSWNAFSKALEAAKTARNADNFGTEDEANTALATMPTLKAAKDALVKVVFTEPKITWERTKELVYSQTGTGDLKTGVNFTAAGDDGSYPTVFWNWSDISDLDTDNTMTVWDFGTANQYAKPTEVKSTDANAGIRAATWVHRDKNGTSAPTWSAKDLSASVRKFAGTFTWPEGYDLDDKASLISVNDSYYQPIYDYVNNGTNADYKEAIKDKFILPANDDIYVFMYAEGDEPTAENYMDYLVFWTGTSGKGVWSSRTNSNADWGKTTPSAFRGIYANRSFNWVTPNLWNTAGISESNPNTDAKDLSVINMDKSLLNQSNGWYTFADTTAGIANVLNHKYPDGIAADTKMHIDIYCFDNDSYGGMDELKLKMVKTPETNVQVEVRYYLDKVTDPNSTNYLGSSYMQDEKVDAKITLLSGTDSNQLNYLKAKAIERANGANVSDGEQQGNIPYIVVQENNVINVVYTSENTKFGEAIYTYDFGVKNQYSNVFDAEKLLGTITDITVPDAVKDYVTFDIDASTITYTPQTVRTSETVALAVTTTNSNNVSTTLTKYITFLPESNVMYEENMLTRGDGSSWTTVGTAASRTVTDHDIPYGYTEAYKADTGYSNGSALRATLKQKQFTDTATFTFTGTGFDLISECGTNTGILLVGLKKANGDPVCGYMVDTYFCGDKNEDGGDGYVSGTGILDYQVPVVRNLNELEYGSYTVTVTGYLPSNAGAVVNGVATQSVSNAAPSVDEIFRAAGMSEYLDAGVEVSFMDDNSVLNGGTGPAVTVTTPSFFSRVRSFFRGLASTQAAADESGSNIYAYIDAFRVYQPLNKNDADYKDEEQNTTYYSLYDFVKNSVNDLEEYTEDVAVYVEYDGSTGVANIADYKDQGPQNEVYLAPGTAIIFGLKDYEENDTVQVSAKQIGNVTAKGIDMYSTSTEMYYDVQVIEEADEYGIHYVVISNEKESKGILALSALKVSNKITAVSNENGVQRVLEGKKDAENAFNPEHLTVTAPQTAKINRSYTFKVQSSKDVAYIMLQQVGEEDAIKLTPTNKRAADAGKVKYYSFSKAFKQDTGGTYNYTVTAYDSEANASASVTVTITVTE